ncbi:MAG: PH domain-containing protein [Propionibacteriales bacterium]|nr:PH domain-containing protein [Propionibacteriales bacterium]
MAYLAAAPRSSWIFAWLAGLFTIHAIWLFVCLQSDVFVITNRRVFRIRGPLHLRFATMPVDRIVDYSVDQSVTGRLCGYGHFVFESAAQDQALREITFVPQPSLRSNEIQDVVQQVEDDSENVRSGGQSD